MPRSPRTQPARSANTPPAAGLPDKPKVRRSTAAQRAEPTILPILPLRDQIYFPQMVFPLLAGRDRSIRAVEEAQRVGTPLVLVAQRDPEVEDPEFSEIYGVGVVAEILQVLRVPDGTLRVMMESTDRCAIIRQAHGPLFLSGEIEILRTPERKGIRAEALMRTAIALFERMAGLTDFIQPEAMLHITNASSPGALADAIMPHLQSIRLLGQQEILEELDPNERLSRVCDLLSKEAEISQVQQQIQDQVEKSLGASQREYVLREQLKLIQTELSGGSSLSDADEYRAKASTRNLSAAALERVLKEAERLDKMPFGAPEGSVIRGYLDWMFDLPWEPSPQAAIDLNTARAVLDSDHYGLESVKERILEFLAVHKLSNSMKGPILCFVGPPGVGKTSIGKSIAAALQRPFVRVSLGGVRDESEIRGHRRTYIGAMPGRIMQGIRQAGSRNPVFMLDEIDKLGTDFRGDPSAALLEALDPEQNSMFSDHYIETPFDLSDVMFITTGNLIDSIPPALRDRLEVIAFPSYMEDEKLAIASRFLLPKVRGSHGLTDVQFDVASDALQLMIREYTREAGVRALEREIAALCRKVARKVAADEDAPTHIDPAAIRSLLGPGRYRFERMADRDEVAAATGLVYTEFGGDLVTIEVGLLPGHEGSVQFTGQLGAVMTESAQTAFSYVRSRAVDLGIPADFYRSRDVHVHVPAGGVPKDGPSAGITIAVAIASALTGRAVRRDLAMTGEITLRGRVLPVGGIKEKLLAAHRAGIKTIIIPEENRRDLEDLPPQVRGELQFVFAGTMQEVLDAALLPQCGADAACSGQSGGDAASRARHRS